MAINPKDFMSTQTGGEGDTIQAEIQTPTPDQFKANIAPIPAPVDNVQQPIEQNIPIVLDIENKCACCNQKAI
jgi:hypothetical protein